MTGPAATARAPRVIFVAALTPPNDGSSGGQYVECSRLLNSAMRSAVQWIPISSTQRTNPAPPAPIRLLGAVGRLFRFLRRLPSADAALIYAANGLSLFEKGLMGLVARSFGKGVVFRFGSGRLPQEVEASALVRWWLRRVLKSAHVVCSQGPVWSEFFSRFPEASGKVMEIPNGIEIPAERAQRNHGARVGFVGWVTRDKGIFEALEVVRRVRPQLPNVRLVVAGGGADFEEVSRLAKSPDLAGAVELLGWVTGAEVARVLNTVDVLLLPSHFEGMPNAVLEAMAAGVPVVCTRVGSLPDLIRDGENGYLCEVEDTAAMAAAVQRLLRDAGLAAQVGQRGRETIRARHAMESVWPKYVQAITSAIEAANGTRRDSAAAMSAGR